MNLQPNTMARLAGIAAVLVCLVFGGGAQGKEITLSDAEIENLVRRSYPVRGHVQREQQVRAQAGWMEHLCRRHPTQRPHDAGDCTPQQRHASAILRIYVPDLEKLKTWSAPQAEKLQP